MEITPERWKSWHAGEEILLRVLFRGSVEADAVLDTIFSDFTDYRQWKETSGEDGSIRLQVKEPGRYMLIARREVQEREDGLYDSFTLTTTMSFLVTK